MKKLVARDALAPSVIRVCADERPRLSSSTVYAVFEDERPESTLIGIVTISDVARFPQRIFADLLPKRVPPPLGADSDLDETLRRMDDGGTDALALIDGAGRFLGAVTRESVWSALLRQERTLIEEIAAREAQLRAMVRAIPDVLFSVDDQGRLVEVLRAEEAGGAFTALAHGGTLESVVPAAAQDTILGGVARALTTRGLFAASLSVGGGQAAREYEARIAPCDGRTALVILRDVTEVHGLRAKLAIADRMLEMGRLAAGVAHEINNPLTYVSMNLDLVREKLTADEACAVAAREALPLLEEMREGLDRVRGTVRDLKMFSRSDDQASTVFDVRHVVEFAVQLAWSEIKHRARLTRDLGQVPPVAGNEGKLGRVVLNLLVNAAQSIEEGHAEDNEIRVVTRAGERREAVIEVRDTGAGIPPEDLDRVFDPFFTTKPIGVGTGLGLAITHGVVTSLGGTIEVESRVGEGSTFRVRLPGADGATTAKAPSTPPPDAVLDDGRGRFLIVDDEEPLARVVAFVLGPERSVACTSGRAALALLERGERFDAIVCDLLMPDLSGMELHERLLAVAPDQAKRMIFMTGGPFTPRSRAFLEAVPNPRLEKPFDAAHVVRAVRALIARQSL